MVHCMWHCDRSWRDDVQSARCCVPNLQIDIAQMSIGFDDDLESTAVGSHRRCLSGATFMEYGCFRTLFENDQRAAQVAAAIA